MSSEIFARRLRKNMTDAERVLWGRLRRRQMEGCRFRRQCPIGPYIADFVCLDRMLVIEVDGGQYAGEQERDAERSHWLERNGFQVLRFWNHEVLVQTDAVLEAIRAQLMERQHL